MGRQIQSSLHFLTSSDKTFFYDQNTLTSRYRQDKKPKWPHSPWFSWWSSQAHLQPSLLPPFPSWKIILDTQAQQNAAMPPNSHTHIQYMFLAAVSEALLFWSNLILTLVPRISTRMGRCWPRQSLPWGLFAHCFHVCLRKRLPQERSCLCLSCKAQTHCWHFSLKSFRKYFYLFHTEQNALSKWCICSATVTNSASSLCFPIPNCMQGRGCIQTPTEELGSRGRGDWEVNTTDTAEAAQEGLRHLN